MQTNEATLRPQLALQFGTWDGAGKLRYSNQVVAITDMRDGSEKWAAFRDANNIGQCNSPVVVVVDTVSGEKVAKVSYNGRVWGTDGKEIEV